jgi:O-antigen ligase
VIPLGSRRGQGTVARPGQTLPLLTTVGASALLAAVVVAAGPRPALLGCLAVLALAVLTSRIDLAIGFYVLINLLSVAKTSLGGFIPAAAASPARSLALAALLLHAVRCVWRGGLPTRALIGPVLPLIGVIGLSLLAAASLPSRAVDALPISGMIAALAIVTGSVAKNRQTASRTLVAIAAAYGLILVLNLVLVPFSSSPAFLGGRFDGILENPNSVGALGFGLPLLVFAWLTQRVGSWQRWMFFLASILLVIEVLMSVSRAGTLGMVASGAVMFVELTRRRLGVRLIVVIVALGAAVLLVLSGLTGRLSVDLRLSTLGGGSGRAAAWAWALHQIAHHPALGYGYGSSPDLFAQYNLQNSLSPTNSGFVGLYAGNVFIDLGLELGAAGIVAFLIACAAALQRIRRTRFTNAPRPGGLAGSACLAALVGGLINAQGESFVTAPGGVVVVTFWFVLLFCSSAGYWNLVRLRHAAAGPSQTASLAIR